MTSNKISILQLLIKTSDLIVKGFKAKKVILIYAILLTFLHILSGNWNYTCFEDKEAWCISLSSNNLVKTILILLFALLQYIIFVSYSYDIYDKAINKKEITIKDIIKPTKNKLKYLGLVTSAIMLIVLPILIVLRIFIKEPNPDWRIEMVSFIMLFILCWIPVIILRISSAISYYLQDNKIRNMTHIWRNTSNSGISIMFVFGLLFLVLNLINMQFRLLFIRLVSQNNNFIISVLSEFSGAILNLFYILCFVMILRAQQEIIDKNTEEKSAEEELEEDKLNPVATDLVNEDNETLKKAKKSSEYSKKTTNKTEKIRKKTKKTTSVKKKSDKLTSKTKKQ